MVQLNVFGKRFSDQVTEKKGGRKKKGERSDTEKGSDTQRKLKKPHF